jgi:hypothetical protein
LGQRAWLMAIRRRASATGSPAVVPCEQERRNRRAAQTGSRLATAQAMRFSVQGLPARLAGLAALYGVTDLLAGP